MRLTSVALFLQARCRRSMPLGDDIDPPFPSPTWLPLPSRVSQVNLGLNRQTDRQTDVRRRLSSNRNSTLSTLSAWLRLDVSLRRQLAQRKHIGQRIPLSPSSSSTVVIPTPARHKAPRPSHKSTFKLSAVQVLRRGITTTTLHPGNVHIRRQSACRQLVACLEPSTNKAHHTDTHSLL